MIVQSKAVRVLRRKATRSKCTSEIRRRKQGKKEITSKSERGYVE